MKMLHALAHAVTHHKADVGLAFDGTLDGVISDWWFDPAINRTIHVDARYMRWVMDKIDGAHRLLHTRALLGWHRFHHRSTAPTPWSNDAIGAVDTALCQGFYAVVPLLVPLPPLVLVAHRAFDHVNGTLGHAGFEHLASRLARWPSPMLCTTYHDLHHSAFHCNFANSFSYLDRLFGTIHPRYDELVAERAAAAPPPRIPAPS